jgi:Sec-independent protein translocase protein TatA
MFGISFWELFVIGFALFLCTGPKKFPELLRQAGRLFVQFRRMSNEVRAGWEDVVREAELDLRAPLPPSKPAQPPSAQAQAYIPTPEEKKEAIETPPIS